MRYVGFLQWHSLFCLRWPTPMELLITRLIKFARFPPRASCWRMPTAANLSSGLDKLSEEIAALRSNLKLRPDLLHLLPDVEIYETAVRTALKYNEFFNVREISVAKGLLEQGMERARQLRDGKAPWNTATGLIVRGYVSKIDGSVQPYGLVVPASYQENTPHRFRLDVWCHGRGETLSEVNFIRDRQSSKGEFTPPNAFVLHPYGRYCNANKFAGEIDLFEALEDVKEPLPDRRRSLGNAWLLDGRSCLLAVRRPLPRHLGRCSSWCRLLGNSQLLESVSKRSGSADMVRTETMASL